MENECLFVCSRGILKSCTFHSSFPKSSCSTDTQYLKDMVDGNKLKSDNSIYVCSDLLSYFVDTILPKLQCHFILVSGDSDLCVPKEALKQSQFNDLIESPFLIKWFAQNTQMHSHEKIVQLPIGLDYHTISANPQHKWTGTKNNSRKSLYLPKEQEEILHNIRSNMRPFEDRIRKIYVNFSLETDRFGQRRNALNQIPANLLAVNMNFTPRTENWKNMTNFAFVLSPFGNGMDCHRTWETLCLGGIPILCAPNFRKMFEGLPVLIVNNWSDITQELLEITVQDFQNKMWNWEKMRLESWVKF